MSPTNDSEHTPPSPEEGRALLEAVVLRHEYRRVRKLRRRFAEAPVQLDEGFDREFTGDKAPVLSTDLVALPSVRSSPSSSRPRKVRARATFVVVALAVFGIVVFQSLGTSEDVEVASASEDADGPIFPAGSIPDPSVAPSSSLPTAEGAGAAIETQATSAEEEVEPLTPFETLDPVDFEVVAFSQELPSNAGAFSFAIRLINNSNETVDTNRFSVEVEVDGRVVAANATFEHDTIPAAGGSAIAAVRVELNDGHAELGVAVHNGNQLVADAVLGER